MGGGSRRGVARGVWQWQSGCHHAARLETWVDLRNVRSLTVDRGLFVVNVEMYVASRVFQCCSSGSVFLFDFIVYVLCRRVETVSVLRVDEDDRRLFCVIFLFNDV